MSINTVTISGNLGQDPELRVLPSGSPVLQFSLAVNERVKNQQTDEWEDRPNWVGCVIFGTRAEKLAQYLHKGMKVAVEGKLRYSSWEKDGQRHSKIEVVVNDLEFMSARDGRPQQPPTVSYQQPTYAQPAAGTPPRQAPATYDEDIPF